MTRNQLAADWIPSLAEPYLRGYSPVLERGRGLRGYWFTRAADVAKKTRQKSSRAGPAKKNTLGFFAGYLINGERWAFLNAQEPECLVFAFVLPVGGPLHKRLVSRPDSLVRGTFEYIRWLTHRRPRFQHYDSQTPAMIRHCSIREWPLERYEHFSRNFFIETLAWLVRSGLVRKFLSESSA